MENKPTTTLEQELLRYRERFYPVVPFRPGTDRLVAMDLSALNTGIPPEPLQHLPRFIKWVNEFLHAAGARYGIGGYNELRNVYSESNVFDGEQGREEPRRLHLGTDIWGRPLTPVAAPLEGLVHSFAFNDRQGDYGATIILAHRLETESFFTLYGHLSLRSLGNLQAGQRIKAGEVFAEFGIPSENGQWPPHLHFQLIKDIGNYSGDYPGVCRNSEKGHYLANCPDPDLLLNLERYLA